MPSPVAGARFPVANGSGSITSGGAAQTIFGGSVPPHGFAIYNPMAAGSDTIWYRKDGVAAAPNAAGSVGLPPGAYYETPPDQQVTGTISVYGATTGDKFTAEWW